MYVGTSDSNTSRETTIDDMSYMERVFTSEGGALEGG